jgi:hypothetical protein
MSRSMPDFDFTATVFEWVSCHLRQSEVSRLEKISRAQPDLFCAAAGYRPAARAGRGPLGSAANGAEV